MLLACNSDLMKLTGCSSPATGSGTADFPACCYVAGPMSRRLYSRCTFRVMEWVVESGIAGLNKIRTNVSFAGWPVCWA